MRRPENWVPAYAANTVHAVIPCVDNRTHGECLAAQGQSEQYEDGILPHWARSTQQAFIVSEFLKKPRAKTDFCALLLASPKNAPCWLPPVTVIFRRSTYLHLRCRIQVQSCRRISRLDSADSSRSPPQNLRHPDGQGQIVAIFFGHVTGKWQLRPASNQRRNRSPTACFITAPPTSDIDRVSGISFGQASTQFCAYPHS